MKDKLIRFYEFENSIDVVLLIVSDE